MVLEFRIAAAADAGRLNAALAHLSADLGDTHQAGEADILRSGFGEHPAFRATLALDGDATAGAALYSPVFSTVKGAAGVYVSDLWVAPDMRGRNLGARMLAAVLRDAQAVWDAGFLKLNVYHSSPRARQFYDRLGFQPAEGQTEMLLGADACAGLRGQF